MQYNAVVDRIFSANDNAVVERIFSAILLFLLYKEHNNRKQRAPFALCMSFDNNRFRKIKLVNLLWWTIVIFIKL